MTQQTMEISAMAIRKTSIGMSLPRYLAMATLVTALAVSALAEERPAIKATTTPTGIEMICVPAGRFSMGSEKGMADEKPVHQVEVDAFCMDKYPVKQKQWRELMKNNPSNPKKDTCPVNIIRWSDAVRYCNARSQAEGLSPCYNLETWECDFTRDGYRLPTEAEWEYACRAGTATTYFFGEQSRKMQVYAWYRKNSGGKIRACGRKRANPWGFVDMYGNVLEWCNDNYESRYYAESPQSNPKGPAEGEQKVLRGGSWNSAITDLGSSRRYKESPAFNDACVASIYDKIGFRCVRAVRDDDAK